MASERCEACNSPNVRYVAITSREPHGETFFDEGLKCLDCGATQMATLPEIPPPANGDYIGALMRSIVLAKNLDSAFRMGVALAEPARRKEVA